MASARVTAQCFSYGQAIGMAAAMCVQVGHAAANYSNATALVVLQVASVQRYTAVSLSDSKFEINEKGRVT